MRASLTPSPIMWSVCRPRLELRIDELPIETLDDAFREAGDPLSPDDRRSTKKNFAERLSRHLSTLVANKLRPSFPGILPSEDGTGQESRARTAKGVKKLDVNYSTLELGLGLGVSIKTINSRDKKSSRYTKNYTRVDNELRAEALDYHLRQPYAVLVGILFLPIDACDDGQPEGTTPSSFGAAVRMFRHRACRKDQHGDGELLERMFLGLYGKDSHGRMDADFFDVEDAPPRCGRPSQPPATGLDEVIARIAAEYDLRNNPPFHWG